MEKINLDISGYLNAETYSEQQEQLKLIAENNNLSIHQTRARLVNLGVYKNKPKHSHRILKSKYVEELVEKLEDEVTETEFEYLERLTVTLLKKLNKKLLKLLSAIVCIIAVAHFSAEYLIYLKDIMLVLLIQLFLVYVLIAGSFSISSYFFIHIPALKIAKIKNDIFYSIAYLFTSFIYFPSVCYAWASDMELFKELLYSGDISNELGLLLEWVDGTNDIDEFEIGFKNLVEDYKTDDEVLELAKIFAHNYTCHKHNRLDAVMFNTEQWKEYTKDASVH